jgi:hypothetical protein
MKVLRGIYAGAAARLGGLLDSTGFQRGKSSILLRQVDAISAALGAQSDRWVTGEMKSKWIESAKAVDRDIESIGVKLGGGSAALGADWLRINQGAVGVFASQLARDLAGANAKLASNARRVIAATSQKVIADPKLSATIAQGLVSGGSIQKIGRSVRDQLTAAGQELLDSGKLSQAEASAIIDLKAGVIQAGGKRMDIGKYATLVAHYQVRQAVVEATKDRLTEQGEMFGDPDLFDLVTVVGPISGDLCDFFVGKIFSISGRSDEFPALGSIPGPPFHPNCTHTIAPFVMRFASGKEIERGRINEKFLNLNTSTAQSMYRGPDRNFAARAEDKGQAAGE